MSAEENKKAGAKAAAPKKKRGRPSKAELAARAKEEGAETATNAASPTGTTGVSPVADATPPPAQPTLSPPGEQPLSNRQRRRLEWLARAAQRNGNRPNFKGMGKHGGPMQPQGNRRLPSEVPQNLHACPSP